MRRVVFKMATRDGPEKCAGYLFEVNGHALVAHKTGKSEWSCTDYATGYAVNVPLGPIRHATRAALVAAARERFSTPAMAAKLKHLSATTERLNGIEAAQ